jgi:uncharacterized protein VcgC/VcgE DUF2780
MHRRIILASLLLAPFAIASAENSVSSLLGSASNPLMGMLTSKLGVSQDQAEGGVGSILKLAQEKLAKGDFDKVAKAIPGASNYLEKAKSLGAISGALGNKDGLMAALGKLGISPDTAAKFIPAVTNFVSKAGGSKVGNLLKSALA